MKKSQVPLDSDDGEEGGDEWLLTYGDLMTQLVCFFVLLMSFSIISSMKFRDVVVSLQDSLNGNGVLSSWMSVADDLPRSFSRNNGNLMELKAEPLRGIKRLPVMMHLLSGWIPISRLCRCAVSAAQFMSLKAVQLIQINGRISLMYIALTIIQYDYM